LGEFSPNLVTLASAAAGLHSDRMPPTEGCQMVCFQTKNPNLGKFWQVLHWKMLVYFMDTWSILRSLVIFYGHLVWFAVIWYIFSRFGILYKEKYGNHAPTHILSNSKLTF
jgi:hypothetical protein